MVRLAMLCHITNTKVTNTKVYVRVVDNADSDLQENEDDKLFKSLLKMVRGNYIKN